MLSYFLLHTSSYYQVFLMLYSPKKENLHLFYSFFVLFHRTLYCIFFLLQGRSRLLANSARDAECLGQGKLVCLWVMGPQTQGMWQTWCLVNNSYVETYGWGCKTPIQDAIIPHQDDVFFTGETGNPELHTFIFHRYWGFLNISKKECDNSSEVSASPLLISNYILQT